MKIFIRYTPKFISFFKYSLILATATLLQASIEDFPNWNRGVEGQRKADTGDGNFLNPILSGDHPDPTILKDGEDYYMTFSSFNSYPGIVIWHSKDLVELGACRTCPTQKHRHSLGA